MDMTSRIAFERAWGKANRLPQEERAIAPTGQVAYAHGVAAGEAKNRETAFASDMEFRDATQAEKGREYELSGEEKARQVLTSLDQRYTQAVAEMGERERQFGGKLAFAGEREGKLLEESARQFGGRLSASGGQFDQRLTAERDLFEKKLNESVYESGKLRQQKMTQFEQSLAFKAKAFDDEMAWTREKFRESLSFNDLVFADKMANERRQLDTWILSNRIGAVIQLANTAVSAYGMKQGLDARKAMNTELTAARADADAHKNSLAYDAAVEDMINEINSAYKTPKYEYDPNAVMAGKFFISDPEEQGTMSVSKPITYSDFAKMYDRMKILPPTRGNRYLSP
jgi:hypothetical protein